MKCNLAIYDYETDYANQLMDYMKRKQKQVATIRVFTNHKSLRDYLEHNEINILLLSECIPVEEVQHENIKKICLLSEGNYIRENVEYPVIYKFQSAEQVMQELFTYYQSELSTYNPLIVEDRNVKVISVFSIARDTEKMVVSLSLAQQYSKIKKTLYINLDIFQALPELLGQNLEKNLSEFIYYLKQNHPNIISKMQGIITKIDSLDYIQGVTFGPDLYELTSEDMFEWIKELKKSSEYDVIIFDVGCFFHATLELFRGSNQLLLLLGENDWEMAKYHNFKGQLLWAGFQDVLDKVTIIPLTKDDEKRYEGITARELYNGRCCELTSAYIEK